MARSTHGHTLFLRYGLPAQTMAAIWGGQEAKVAPQHNASVLSPATIKICGTTARAMVDVGDGDGRDRRRSGRGGRGGGSRHGFYGRGGLMAGTSEFEGCITVMCERGSRVTEEMGLKLSITTDVSDDASTVVCFVN